MPRIIINIYCNKVRKQRRTCIKHVKTGSPKRRRRNCRKKTRAYKTLCVVNRINIKPTCVHSTRPSISIRPIVKRYFFVTTNDMNLKDGIVLLPNQFVDDGGNIINEFADFGQEGYYNLYVNGVLQEGEIYRVNRHAITLTATTEHITEGTPIIIESVGFTTRIVNK